MTHDPRHVAHLAAVILSSRPEPEAHHIKAAVASARAVLDEAHRCAAEDEVAAAAETDAPAPVDSGPDMLGERAGAEKTEDQGTESKQ